MIHLNTADSNNSEAITAHYKGLIANGLEANSVQLVVTDMLAAYNEPIENIFPNALHQYCIFHFIQLVNKDFKNALKEHRHKHFTEGERKAAHKISFLMLKGQETLSDQERDSVFNFCEQYPDIMEDYALKEDIRTLYALAKTEIEAVAWKDIIIEQYESKISAVMQKTIQLLNKSFEKTISYLKVGILHAKTNNDAERIMRKIEQNQKIHYFFRNDESLIRHLNTRLGLFIKSAT